jgi:hypothetical protein
VLAAKAGLAASAANISELPIIIFFMISSPASSPLTRTHTLDSRALQQWLRMECMLIRHGLGMSKM